MPAQDGTKLGSCARDALPAASSALAMALEMDAAMIARRIIEHMLIHHLRLLRSLRLVRARRSGRNVFYSLHDHHIADLLAAVRHHHEHVHPPPAAELPEVHEAQT